MNGQKSLIACLAIVLMLTGCHGSKSPTAPTIPDQLEQVNSEPEYSDEFWASKGDKSFQVNLPKAGDYRLEYTTNLGTFEIIFRIGTSLLLTVELKPGNDVLTVVLQKGVIDGSPSNTSQAVEIFEHAVFVMDPTFGTLVLITEGSIVLTSPTPTPTPPSTPLRVTPTPTPIPRLTPSPTPQLTPTPTPTPQSGTAAIIVAVGDSITQGHGSSLGTNGYPGILNAKLRAAGYNVVVYNKGLPGADSYTVDMNFQYDAGGANIALIMVGTNDISASGSCVEPYNCRTIDHIRSMIDKALAAGIIPIVGTITPDNPDGVYSSYNHQIENVNQEILRLGAARGVRVVDTYDPILNNGGSTLFSDKHHLNDRGYEILAETWYRVLVDLLAKPR